MFDSTHLCRQQRINLHFITHFIRKFNSDISNSVVGILFVSSNVVEVILFEIRYHAGVYYCSTLSSGRNHLVVNALTYLINQTRLMSFPGLSSRTSCWNYGQTQGIFTVHKLWNSGLRSDQLKTTMSL